MLKTIEFKNDYRCFKVGDLFNFRDGVNLLVGDQGSGKTTLIDIFRGGRKEFSDIVEVTGDPVTWFHFDFEKDNPRKRSYIKTGFDVRSRYASHGELNLAILGMLKNSKDLKSPSLIIMDEADMALSIRSCRKLVSIFNDLRDAGHQIISIVHNIIVVQAYEEVLSLEHKRWMKSKEFIDSQI